MIENCRKEISRVTQWSFICTRLMGTPCWCLLNMLVFILYKNIHLTPLQIIVIVALKPAASLLSPYWCQSIYQRPHNIVPNLIGANFLRHLPFLFVPWINSAWYMIIAFGMNMVLARATIPAWMELFKSNLPDKKEQTVGYGTMIDYIGNAVFSVAIGYLLDYYPHIWKWLFFFTAALGALSTCTLLSIPTPDLLSSLNKISLSFSNIREKTMRPWKQVWQLLLEDKKFALFQVGFMFGGGGLMVMQPALPQLFIDNLHLSFVEMGLAIAFCKAIGVLFSSSLWANYFRRVHIFQFCTLVTFFAALFPFFLLASSFHIFLLYIAYIFYGIMQAGSELNWHMSGLVFAKEKDSSIYSITNILTVGIRGSILPLLGGILLESIYPLGVMLFGALLCLLGSFHFILLFREENKRIFNTKNIN